ncbi:beta strand repeat-containing protein [Geomonas paludis]|uniref:Uncharacterized protein n=1 Tax=Geomonas paludis TaxID=2740185 RepID=A0A6V8MUT5_9BACT|nr:calcium-binding protein [Geomonas paludis]GFO63477.1 hypothetical protein GMPD_13960 [Geomonas paludis]
MGMLGRFSRFAEKVASGKREVAPRVVHFETLECRVLLSADPILAPVVVQAADVVAPLADSAGGSPGAAPLADAQGALAAADATPASGVALQASVTLLGSLGATGQGETRPEVSIAGTGGDDAFSVDLATMTVAGGAGTPVILEGDLLRIDGGDGNDTLVITGTDGDDVISVDGEHHLVTVNSTSISYEGFEKIGIDGGAGTDDILVGSSIVLEKGVSLAAETITVNGNVTAAAGDISLVAVATGDGILGDVRGRITVNDAELTGANIFLTAASTVTATAGDLIDAPDADVALIKVASHAEIEVGGASLLTGAGQVTLTASSTVDTTAVALANTSKEDTETDAAVAASSVDSAAAVHIGGSTSVTAGGTLVMGAANRRTVRTVADGSAGGAGGSVAVAVVSGNTEAVIDESASVSAGSITVVASSVDDISTEAKAASGGATNDGAAPPTASERTLAEHDARTGAGNVAFAAAVAVTELDHSTTRAGIASSGPVLTSGLLTVRSLGAAGSSATADGSSVAAGSTGAGVAVALNLADVDHEAYIGGSGIVGAGGVVLEAGGAPDAAVAPQGEGVSAVAVSGHSAGEAEVAGALAQNIADVGNSATIRGGATVVIMGGDVALTAQSNTSCTATARPESEGEANPGVGVSVALNVGNAATVAELQDGATVTGASDLTLISVSSNSTETAAKGGGAANGVGGEGGAVSVTVANSLTRADLGSGPAQRLSGDLTVIAGHIGGHATAADGSAAGDNAAMGTALALDMVADTTLARTGRDVEAGGGVTLAATTLASGVADAKASTVGAQGESDGADPAGVDGRVAQERELVNQKAASAGTVGASDAPESPGAATSAGGVSVAAAIGVNLADSGSRAIVADGVSITCGGTLTVRAGNNSDGSAKADGSTTSDSSPGIGAAVAINAPRVTSEASIGSNARVRAGGLLVEATVPDRFGDTTQSFSAEATAGASSGKTGVAGALAVDVAHVSAGAVLKSGAEVTIAGDATLSAETRSVSNAWAAPEGVGAAAGDLGVGASVAFNIADAATVAELEDGAALLGGDDVTLSASSDNSASTTARAGAAAGGGSGTGIGGAVACTVANSETRADLGSGGELGIAGDLTVSASHTGRTVTQGDGSSTGTRAGVGLVLALNVGDDTTTATTGRDVAASERATFAAQSSAAKSAEAKASAAGGKATPGVDGGVDGQVAQEREQADRKAAAAGSKGSADAPATPKAETPGGAVSVAAAVAVNLSASRVQAYLPEGGSITAAGPVTVSAADAGDASATADGSATGLASVGIGAAVAINSAEASCAALVGSNASVRAGDLYVESGGSRTFAAEAVSGACAGGVGVAGGLAVNTSDAVSSAVIGSGARIETAGGDVSLAAENVAGLTAKARPEALLPGAGVGVGASVAINVGDTTTRAEIEDGATIAGAGDVLLSSISSRSLATTAAGGASGGTTVTPAVAVAIADDQVTARVGALADGALTVSGEVVIEADRTATAALSADADAAGSDVAVGVSLTSGSCSASLARDLDAGGTVNITARTRQTSGVDVTGGAQGTPALGSSVDGEISRQLQGTPATAGASVPTVQDKVAGANATALLQSGTSGAAVGVAAAIGVNRLESENAASVAAGVKLTAAGAARIDARSASAATAKATGAAQGLANATGVGAAVAVNEASLLNRAAIGAAAEVSADGITVRAAMTPSTANNNFSVSAEAAGGGRDYGIAGAAGVNDLDMVTEASVGAGARLASGGGIDITATDALAYRNRAGGAGSGVGTGVGASLAANLISQQAYAVLGSGVEADAAGATTVAAGASIGQLDPDYATVAIGHATTTGGPSVAGSGIVDVVAQRTKAGVADGATLNASEGGASGAGQSVTVAATSTMGVVNGAGGLAGTVGATGVGICLDVGVVTKETEAYISAGAKVYAHDSVTLKASSVQNVTSLALSAGAAVDGGTAGCLTVFDLKSLTRAAIDGTADHAATVRAGGALEVSASDTSNLNSAAVTLPAAAGTAVGAATATNLVAVTAVARIAHADVAAGGVTISASSLPCIRSLSAGVSGSGGTAVSGAIRANSITSSAEAHVEDSALESAGNVVLDAREAASGTAPGFWHLLPGGVANEILSTAADTPLDWSANMLAASVGLATAGGSAVGGAIGRNELVSTVRSRIRNSEVSAAGSVTLGSLNKSSAAAYTAGLSASGEFALDAAGALNDATATVEAVIDGGASVTAGQALDLRATDDSSITSVALNLAASGSTAGGVNGSVNLVDHTTRAAVDGSQVKTGAALGLRAVSNAAIDSFARAAAASGNAAGVLFATVNRVWNTTGASIENGAEVHAAGAVSLFATDTSRIDSVAFGVSASGGIAAGAAVAANLVTSEVRSAVAGSSLESGSFLTMVSRSSATVRALAIGCTGSGSIGATLAVLGNSIDTTVTSKVTGSTVYTADDVRVEALETAPASTGEMPLSDAQKSERDRALGATPSGFQGANVSSLNVNLQGSGGVAAGIALTGNSINGRIEAEIVNSTLQAGVDSSGAVRNSLADVTLTALAGSKISAVTTGMVGSGSVAASATGFGNVIHGTLSASIRSGSTVKAGGAATLSASDRSEIRSVAHSVTGSGAIAAGALIGSNVISGTTEALVSGSSVRCGYTLELWAASSADLLSFSGGVAGAGAISGILSLSANTVDNQVAAGVVNEGAAASDVDAEDTITVSARSNSTIDALAFGVAGSGGGAAGAAVSVNEVGGSIQTRVSGSTLDCTDGGLNMSAASSQAVRSVSYGVAGSGGFGLNLAGVGNVVRNSISSRIDGATVRVRGDVNLAAGDGKAGILPPLAIPAQQQAAIADATADSPLSSETLTGSNILSLVVGTAGAGAGALNVALVGNSIGNSIGTAISASNVTSTHHDINLDARSDSGIVALTAGLAVSGGVSIDARGMGNTVRNRIESAVDNGSMARASIGGVVLSAQDASSIDSAGLSFSGAAGLAGATMVAVNDIANAVSADIKGATVLADLGLQLSALEDADVFSSVRGVAASAGGSAALSLAVNEVGNTTTASITDCPYVRSNQGVALVATDLTTVEAVGVGFSAAAGGALGAAASRNEIGNGVHATVSNATVVGGDIALAARSTPVARSFAGGMGLAGFAGIAAAQATNTVANAVDAAVHDATVTSRGSVSITASDAAPAVPQAENSVIQEVNAVLAGNGVAEVDPGANIAAVAASFQAALGVSAGAALVDNEIDNTVKAEAVNANLTAANDIAISAGSRERVAALAAGRSIAAVAGSASSVDNGSTTETTADISGRSTVSAGGNIAISATDNLAVDSLALNLAAGAGAVGGARTSTTIVDNTHAFFEGSSAGMSQIVKAASLDILADSDYSVSGRSRGLADALIAAGSSEATATVLGATKAYVGDHVEIGAAASLDDIGIKARSGVSLTSNAEGLTGGVLAGGRNAATATIDPTVAAFVGNAHIAAGRIGVTARGDVAADTDVKGRLVAVGAVGESESRAQVSPTVSAAVAPGARIEGGALAISSECAAGADAFGTASVASVVDVTGAEVTAPVTPRVTAAIGDNAVITVTGMLSVTAGAYDRANARAESSTLGVLKQGGISSNASLKPVITSRVGNGARIAAGEVSLQALHNMKADGSILEQGDESFATLSSEAVFGGSGVTSRADLVADVLTDVGDGATVTSTGDISLLAYAFNKAHAEVTGTLTAGAIGSLDVVGEALQYGSTAVSTGAGVTLKAGEDLLIAAHTQTNSSAKGGGSVEGGVSGGKTRATATSEGLQTTAAIGANNALSAAAALTVQAEKITDIRAEAQLAGNGTRNLQNDIIAVAEAFMKGNGTNVMVGPSSHIEAEEVQLRSEDLSLQIVAKATSSNTGSAVGTSDSRLSEAAESTTQVVVRQGTDIKGTASIRLSSLQEHLFVWTEAKATATSRFVRTYDSNTFTHSTWSLITTEDGTAMVTGNLLVEQTAYYTQDQTLITFNSDVEVLTPPAQLVVNADGTVTGDGISAHVVDGSVVVDAVANTGTGKVRFDSPFGTLKGNASFVFSTSMPVHIVNRSQLDLVVNDIDTIGAGVVTPDLTFAVADRRDFHYTVGTAPRETALTIENYGDSSIRLAGFIDNSYGTTAIYNFGRGDIFAQGGTVRSRAVKVDSRGDIGASGALLPIELTQVALSGVVLNPELTLVAAGDIHAEVRGLDLDGNGSLDYRAFIKEISAGGLGELNLWDSRQFGPGAIGNTPPLTTLPEPSSPTAGTSTYLVDKGGTDTGNLYLFSSDNDLELAGAIDYGSGDVVISTAGSIKSVSAGQVISAGSIVIDSRSADVGELFNPIRVDTGTGTLSSVTAGDVHLAEVSGDMRVGVVFTNAGVVALSSAGGISDSSNGDFASISGSDVTLVAAGGIGTADDMVQIDSGLLQATAGEGIYLEEVAGDLNLDRVLSATGDVVLEADGSIVDSGNDREADVIARGISLVSRNGHIGEGPDGLQVDSSASEAGLLDATAAGDIHLTETVDDMRIGEITSESGAVTLVVYDSYQPGDTSSATVFGAVEAGGKVELLAGDNVQVLGRITAGDSVRIQGDYQDADPGIGTTLELIGAVEGKTVSILGGDDDDRIGIVSVAAESASVEAFRGDDLIYLGRSVGGSDRDGLLDGIDARLTVDGGQQNDTDLLLLDDSADTSADSGIVTDSLVSGFGMGGVVHYREIESLTVLAGAGPNSIGIRSTAVGTETSVVGGRGDDIFNVSSDAPENLGNLDGIRSDLRLDAGGGDNTLNVSDRGNASGRGSIGADAVITDHDITGMTGDGLHSGTISFQTSGRFTGGVNIYAGSGNDRIAVESTLSGTVTTVKAGEGRDLLAAEGEGGADNGVLALFGEGGADVINGAAWNSALVVFGDSGELTLSGEGALLAATGTDTGVGANDSIMAGDGTNSILGGGGDDRIMTGNGDNTVLGDNGAIQYGSDGRLLSVVSEATAADGVDSIMGGDGDNVVAGGGAGDLITTGSGNDVILGDDGSASFRGGVLVGIASGPGANGGDDVIHAGGGNNTVIGGLGKDTITTGNGYDIIIGDNGEAAFTDGGVITSVATRDPARGDGDTIAGANGTNIMLGGTGGDTITGGSGFDVVIGDNGRATFTSGRLATISSSDPAYDGDDIIRTFGGGDVILGGTGDDIIKPAEAITFARPSGVREGSSLEPSAPILALYPRGSGPADGATGNGHGAVASELSDGGDIDERLQLSFHDTGPQGQPGRNDEPVQEEDTAYPETAPAAESPQGADGAERRLPVRALGRVVVPAAGAGGAESAPVADADGADIPLEVVAGLLGWRVRSAPLHARKGTRGERHHGTEWGEGGRRFKRWI